MNFIAVTLLQQISDEEDAFWALVFILFERKWRDIFDEHSAKIAYLLNDLENYLITKQPELYDHFVED